jgi:hypothetical protein
VILSRIVPFFETAIFSKARHFYLNLIIGCLFFSCNKEPGSEGIRPLENLLLETETENLSGARLASIYCGYCHKLPEPQLLDKYTWEDKVLPDMRRRLGLITSADFGVAIGEDAGFPKGTFSEVPLVNREEWDKIKDFYLTNAPEALALEKERAGRPFHNGPLRLNVPSFAKKRPNATTYLGFNPSDRYIFVGDRLNRMYLFDARDYGLKDSILLSSPPSAVRFLGKHKIEILTMGFMDPSNLSIGTLEEHSRSEDHLGWTKEVLVKGLERPVHFSVGDITLDGKEEIIISNFGNHTGSLLLFREEGEGYAPALQLKKLPGSRRTLIVDMNRDGLPDIIVGSAQAREGIYALFNNGNGGFEEIEFLSFHPLFGLADFEMVDINGDGHLDILLANGDNADLSPVLKPYHGIRLFLNDGKNNFKEKWFFPMYGAFKVISGDFDQDGDLDLVAISFFPEKNADPRQDLIYFENQGNLNFEAQIFDQLPEGNWMTLEKADIDGDGDVDILVGNFQMPSLYQNPKPDWMPFFILENDLF